MAMRRRVKQEDQVRLVLGILLDVVFILLAVLLVNVCPMMLHGHVEGLLPGL